MFYNGNIDNSYQISSPQDFINACRCGNIEVVTKLITSYSCKKKILSIYLSSFDIEGNTALHYACQEGHISVVRALLKVKAKVNCFNKIGYSPLHYAAMYNNDNIILLLLRSGADVNCRGEYSRTPLHIASFKGYFKCASLLITTGANVNACSNENGVVCTSLLNAVRSKNYELVKLLIEKGADFIDNKEPVIEAIISDDANILELFITAHEKKYEKGNRVLDIYTRYQEWAQETISDKRDCSKALALLLEKNKRMISHKFQYGNQLLHMAVLTHAVNSIRTLLERGAEVNASGQEERKPLHIAAFKGDDDVASLLVQYGADINCQTRFNESPLQCAIRAHKPNSDMIKLLLSSGANIEHQNFVHEDIMEEAIHDEKHHIIQIIWDFARINMKEKCPEKFLLLQQRWQSFAIERKNEFLINVLFDVNQQQKLKPTF